uniref:hypothetical protein n=1 Tax=uncultured Altererythrobacter sp. TaxID=500840 RepID=UPI0026259278|nr:hypothetical protein [uncultured Altererythrobacter sp.]
MVTVLAFAPFGVLAQSDSDSQSPEPRIYYEEKNEQFAWLIGTWESRYEGDTLFAENRSGATLEFYLEVDGTVSAKIGETNNIMVNYGYRKGMVVFRKISTSGSSGHHRHMLWAGGGHFFKLDKERNVAEWDLDDGSIIVHREGPYMLPPPIVNGYLSDHARWYKVAGSFLLYDEQAPIPSAWESDTLEVVSVRHDEPNAFTRQDVDVKLANLQSNYEAVVEHYYRELNGESDYLANPEQIQRTYHRLYRELDAERRGLTMELMNIPSADQRERLQARVSQIAEVLDQIPAPPPETMAVEEEGHGIDQNQKMEFDDSGLRNLDERDLMPPPDLSNIPTRLAPDHNYLRDIQDPEEPSEDVTDNSPTP